MMIMMMMMIEKAEEERQERAASERKAQVLMFQHMTNLMAQNQQSRQPLIVGSSIFDTTVLTAMKNCNIPITIQRDKR